MKDTRFRFKQFIIEQDRCTMKVGSDAVLMGSLLNVPNSSKNLLEIGASTGVISLMLAQRYPDISIQAIEIDESSADVCQSNFDHSNWKPRLQSTRGDFLNHTFERQFDHIYSNPPYFLNALKSDKDHQNISKHIHWEVFEQWLLKVDTMLQNQGLLSFILPTEAFNRTHDYLQFKNYKKTQHIAIQSFANSEQIRHLCTWQKQGIANCDTSAFVIYDAEKVHSQQYIEALKDFLIIF